MIPASFRWDRAGMGRRFRGLRPERHLRTSRNWLAGEGSNLQHPAPKADVLPIELPAKGLKGITPVMTSLASRCSLPLSCRTKHKRGPSSDTLTRQAGEPSL